MYIHVYTQIYMNYIVLCVQCVILWTCDPAKELLQECHNRIQFTMQGQQVRAQKLWNRPAHPED